MIKKYTTFIVLIFIVSCSRIDLVLKETDQQNQLKKNTLIVLTGDVDENFSRELYSFFGNNKNYEYILKTSFTEKKENRIVKQNQVAEKVEYTLKINYDLFYKTVKCKIFSKKIVSNFSFTPRSAGYNFGADMSLDKLYTSSIKRNIQNFVGLGPFDKGCIK